MKTPQLTFKKTAMVLALTTLLGAQTTVYSRTTAPGPEVTIGTATVAVNVSNSDTLIKVVIRVPLPDGTVEERVSNTSTVEFDATGLADGKYLYEAWALLSNSDGKYTTDNSRGSFEVSGGSIVQAPAAKAIGSEDDEASLINDVKEVVQTATIATLDFLIPPASAADLTASDSTPSVFFHDTTDSSGSADRDWYIVADDTLDNAEFRIYDDIETAGWNNQIVFEIAHPAVGKSTKNSFVADDQGNVSFADGGMFLNKVSGKMGLGTIAPVQGIHGKYSGKAGLIRMEDTTESTWDFGQSASGDFLVSVAANGNAGPTGTRMIIRDETGHMGVGVGTPNARMHVADSPGAGEPVLLVEDTEGSGAVRTPLKLTNKGPVGFEMEDINFPVTWAFRSNTVGDFIINDVGDGAELTLERDGDARFSGTVRANGVLLTSSRASKTDFSAIKPNEIMQKLAKMNVEEWRYKEADKNDRHISPMAEDFHSLFKFGSDNTGINPNDLASVAIIAAKELQKKSDATNAKLEAETVALKAENNKLQKRLASLEKLVTNLASSNEHLNRSGAKVALK